MQFDSFNKINYDLIKEKLNNAKVVRLSKKQPSYIDISASFDTETTSTYMNDEKFAFMYVWQFGIDGYYCYGRTWGQFLVFCSRLKQLVNLSDDKRLIIYIHNLSFEFQFFRKYFKWSDVFATDKREPIKALTTLGIEFRDSLILSGYKLENVAKNLTSHKVKKLVGDLDYSKIRNKLTTFTKEELGYMLNDVVILVDYIDEQREQYGNIAKIPLTNTGRVRQLARKNCYSHGYLKYREIMDILTLDDKTYTELKEAFAGGFTHANPDKVGKTFNNVSSIDFTSSYPTVMISEKYPMSKAFNWVYTNMNDFLDLCKKRLVIFQVEFTNLIAKENYSFDNYLSKSRGFKDQCELIVENNGRVYSARKFTQVMTNIDFEIVRKMYDWDNIKISRVKYFYKHYLPTPIIETIVDLYKKKTTLKGVTGKTSEYMHAKGMLNSMYGMSVTDIVRDQTIYTASNGWGQEPADVKEQIKTYNEKRNRVLFYAWGVFVTAYARRNLFTGILSVKDDYIYSDTDSIKMLNYDKHKNYVENYNKEIRAKLSEALFYHNLPKDSLEPKTVKGVKKPLGVWDFEGTYKKFKTLGAKKYIYEDENGELETTIAGLPKKNGKAYLLKISNNDMNKVFENFNPSFSVPKEFTGKLLSTYIDEEKSFLVKDYQGHVTRETALSSTHLEPTSFTINFSETFANFLQSIGNGTFIKDKYKDLGA